MKTPVRSMAEVLWLVGLPVMVAAAQEAATDSAPVGLFASHDVLTLTLEAPLKTVLRDRNQQSSYHPAALFYDGPDGSRIKLDVRLKTRGKTRLQRRICGFPPLRIDFRKGQVQNTVFAAQDALKIVTHCQDRRDQYEQSVLLEYLIYRTYNELTDLSFRVRLARITYIDTDGDRDPITKYAFFIEDEDAMAARNGWEALKVPVVPPEQTDPTLLNLVEVFQFMIGNTDWDAFQREPDRNECCHNVKPIGTMAGPVLPVPYDFDSAGLINARYARPDRRLRIRSVRERLYRGLCRPEEAVNQTLVRFNEQRAAIYDLFERQEGLEDKYREEAVKYLDRFYEIINEPRLIRRELVRNCRQE